MSFQADTYDIELAPKNGPVFRGVLVADLAETFPKSTTLRGTTELYAPTKDGSEGKLMARAEIVARLTGNAIQGSYKRVIVSGDGKEEVGFGDFLVEAVDGDPNTFRGPWGPDMETGIVTVSRRLQT